MRSESLFGALVAAGFAVTSSAANLPETWPVPLAQALSHRDEPSLERFQLTFITDQFSAVVQFDPGLTPGRRANIVKPPPAAWASQLAETASKLEKSADRLLWCDQRASDMLPTAVRVASENAGEVTYEFSPRPAAGTSAEEVKLQRNLIATVTVSKTAPAVLGMTLRASRPFKPSILTRVDTFDAVIDCRPVSGGRSVAVLVKQRMAGSAFGQSFDDRLEQRIEPLPLRDQEVAGRSTSPMEKLR